MAQSAPGTPFSELKGVGPKTIEKLEAHGVTSVEKLADMTPEQLVEIPGIGEKMVEKIRQAVAAYFEALEAQQAAAVVGPEGGVADASAELPTKNAVEPAAETDAGPVAAEAETPQPAAEFRKILDQRGAVFNEPIGALAHLGLARAYVLQGDTAKARTAYNDFFTLWKDADPDIPILREAKVEYAKLK